MIPAVFTYDFPERCIALLDALESPARNTFLPAHGETGPLITTFAISMAMPLIIVPIERLGTYRNASKQDRAHLPQMYERVKRELMKPFGQTCFRGNGRWSLATTPHIVRAPADWASAIDQVEGLFAPRHRQALDNLSGSEVLNGLRHALAHGSIAYLDEAGRWEPGQEAKIVAFIATDRTGHGPDGSNIFCVSQEDLLLFLRAWAGFLMDAGRDEHLVL